VEKSTKIKLGISLRVFITLTTIILCGIALWSYAIFSKNLYYKQNKAAVLESVKLQSEILSNKLITNEFKINNNVDLNNEIESIATSCYGRVMIINSDYKIIKDTFVNANNSYIISENVIRVMTGKQSEAITSKDEYIECIFPVVYEDTIQGVILINASTESVSTIAANVSSKNIMSFAIILIVCMVVSSMVAIISVRGIKRLNNHMEIIKEGHLDDQMPVAGFPEIRKLAENYNDAINKLKVLDSTRQEFVSNVSHELKTPITSMKVLADSIVQNESADLDMYKEFMKDIVDEIDRESQIISDLLTLVKTDRKSAEMNIEEVDVNALLEVILKRVTPIASSRGIEITYESYRDVVADVDGVKLSLAISNIIENAVKYNVDNGWIKVTLNADHKNFHIKVADSGVGIPDDCKEQVFEKFYRVDKARSRDTGGTGLGLAITKNVIKMHKGTIKLYSESGEGTTFTIKIPIKRMES